METIRILAVDDHKMTVLGYKYILEDAAFDNFEVSMEIATSYDVGQQKIEDSAKNERYDIIMLDIQLFPSEAQDSRSGEDLGKLARELVPDTKIVYMSSFSDSLRLQSLFKSVNPNGYMVKSEIDEQTLKEMVNTLTRGNSYYSESATSVMKKFIVRPFSLDPLDQKILYQLSIGTKTKDIEKVIPLSSTAIESRKRKLKASFGIEDKTDFALINEARDRGFL
jgi:DNA-binding NarL/FixJ family response regulator